MALLFVDSFDHYTSPAMMTRKWTTGGAGSIVSGRTGNGFNYSAVAISKTLGSGSGVTSMAAGLAYITQAFANAPIQFPILPGGYVELNHVGDGRFQVVLNLASSFVSAPSTLAIVTNQWFYLELQVTFSAPNVSYVARVNGGTILSGTFTSTGLTSSHSLDGFTPIGPGGGYNCTIDDVYVTDGELLGDVRIYCLFPRLDGTTVQWVPSAGTSHYPLVNEHNPDDMATVVSCDSSHVGNIDEYYLDSIGAFSGSIKGTQANWCVIKSDAGAASVQGLYNNGSTTVNTAAVMNPSSSSWAYFLDPQRESVFTGSDWTVAEINGMQLGLKRTS